MKDIKMPVGYLEFHKDPVINFQLNARLYSSGIFDEDEITEVSQRIYDFQDWKNEMVALASRSEQKGNYLQAATAYRAAEFFATIDDQDKKKYYDMALQLYRIALKDQSIEISYVDFEEGKLYCMKFKPDQKKCGTIILHGGYDSFIEEFYNITRLMVNRGFEVIMFEGPGQGQPLYNYNMKMIHNWEKPVAQILDNFELDDVTLIGISFGGYLAARAAAFESRIKRVVLFDIIYDFYGAVLNKKSKSEKIVTQILMALKAKNAINGIEKTAREHSKFASWLIDQGYYIFGVNNLYDYMEKIKIYSTKSFNHLIKQDVLLMEGEEDMYMCFWEKQKKALKNAKSVTGRVFTKKEAASHHCQVGNYPLAIHYILDWIESKTNKFY
ncbi:alpha/beta fold hydrolase [Vallitalea okinawensis]|uniref:alpha/beta fold hydrolase n=1 Tax=Vallitalea okinawensis TaxID=2078660 RepID=UPI000CFA923D|nr:alpha/beta fold hydrolase [Vallitalea okinawensis]